MIGAISIVALGVIFVLAENILSKVGPGADDGFRIGQSSNDSPTVLSPTINNRGYISLFEQFFQFNPDNHELGLASSQVIGSHMGNFGGGGLLSGTMQGQYGMATQLSIPPA